MNGKTAAWRGFWIGVAAMAIVVAVSNVLVQHQMNKWWTWAALTYPISFLVTDLTNRALGPTVARRVVYAGFACGIVLSIIIAELRIALASGAAFLVAQLLDIYIFDKLRQRLVWWQAPLASSSIASAVDTLLFFGLAFAGTAVPWMTLAVGDYGAKLAMSLVMLIPFRALMPVIHAKAVERAGA